MSRIRVHLKGRPGPQVSDVMSTAEAERLLREQVAPKLGRDGVIALPGLVVNAKETVYATVIASPNRGHHHRPT